MPNTMQEWNKIAGEYFSHWQFPMCIGAIDGKRILLEKPANSGSEFYDYKGHFSIILLAVVDADYKFIFVDIAGPGRASDGGVWDMCSMKKALESEDNVLNIPSTDRLPFSDKQCPFVLVGDAAFPLTSYLMKPYPGHQLPDDCNVFNYRLSRARRMSENVFGILAARFQIFRSPIRVSPTKAKDIALATITLHNYLRVCSKETYIPSNMVDREDIPNQRIIPGQWRQYPQDGLERLPLLNRGQFRDAKEIRDTFKEYFQREGRVAWQERMCHLH